MIDTRIFKVKLNYCIYQTIEQERWRYSWKWI